MTGYQEILSDPSYCGQIVTMTYPLIGNYGINRDDFETIRPAVHGLIVKEAANTPSYWRSMMSLDDLLKERQIPGLQGVDTRKLTRLIRRNGTMKGKLCDMDANPHDVANELKNTAFPIDQVKRVSTAKPYASPGRGFRVVLVDYGMKHGILRELNKRGCDVVVVPYLASAKEILQQHPDGVMLSNGPGNPKDVPEAIETIRHLIGVVPLFGICLGHQLFALASGADTVKMTFGHRGSNHPVKELATGKIAITAQNHGYTVDEASLKHTDLRITHVAINDGTIEGLAHNLAPAFTVQYHPEASPGPEDANSLFEQFIEMMKSAKKEGVRHA